MSGGGAAASTTTGPFCRHLSPAGRQLPGGSEHSSSELLQAGHLLADAAGCRPQRAGLMAVPVYWEPAKTMANRASPTAKGQSYTHSRGARFIGLLNGCQVMISFAWLMVHYAGHGRGWLQQGRVLRCSCVIGNSHILELCWRDWSLRHAILYSRGFCCHVHECGSAISISG